MMMLFSDAQRTDEDFKRYTESDYEYLDRSARPESGRIRDLLNRWYSRYPDDHKTEIAARLRSKDTDGFSSAVFELALFAVCQNLGFVVTVHPDPGTTGAKPDFLLTNSIGTAFYLEGVQVSGSSDSQRAANALKNVVMDAINQVHSPDFSLGIESEGSPATAPSCTRLTADLAKWLASLDPDVVAKDFDARGTPSLPRWLWEHDGWKLTFEALPKSPEARGRSSPTIIYMGLEAEMLDSARDIRAALVKKANHYGDLKKPFLIAVNATSWGLDDDDEVQAVFGDMEFVCSVKDLSAPPVMQLKPDGAWRSLGGPRYTRISGAWFFHGLSAWNLVRCKHGVWLNPWAVNPVPNDVLVIPHVTVDGDRFVRKPGKSLGELLDLPAGWPRTIEC
jgi:hypothetical protein